ncbi:MAG: ATP-binding cassette domain-containing protein [Candidatus Heimdallarchaeota archaeon]|nr:ATP-binding cassette domain-containing protein [Candidatus Heimdallarchaeota archaeon]
MQDVVLAVEDLMVQYTGQDYPALNDITFSINRNDCVIINGKNGSGKTTLVKSLLKLFPRGSLAKASGSITIQENASIVLQNPKTQLFTFRVDEEISTPLAYRKVARELRKRSVDSLLSTFDLEDLRDKDPRNLSAGQQQIIVSLAAIIADQSILILDEPFSLLDSDNENILMDFLKELKQRGHTIIIIDHQINRYIGLADLLLKLDNGVVSFFGQFPNPSLQAGEMGRMTVDTSYKRRVDDPLLSIDASLGYRSEIVSLDMQFSKEKILITGKNGSGKSTILKSIAGIIEPLRGKSISESKAYFVPADPSTFFWRRTVKEEVHQQKIDDWVVKHWERSPFMLSEGEKKRLMMSIAFHFADLILLDEPSSSLDDENKQWLISQLQRTDKTILLTSNDRLFVQSISHIVDEILELST